MWILTPISPDDRDRSEDFAGTPDLQPDRICDMTMKEIGDAMGVNESRVSQIHKAALKKMQSALETEGIQSAKAF